MAEEQKAQLLLNATTNVIHLEKGKTYMFVFSLEDSSLDEIGNIANDLLQELDAFKVRGIVIAVPTKYSLKVVEKASEV